MCSNKTSHPYTRIQRQGRCRGRWARPKSRRLVRPLREPRGHLLSPSDRRWRPNPRQRTRTYRQSSRCHRRHKRRTVRLQNILAPAHLNCHYARRRQNDQEPHPTLCWGTPTHNPHAPLQPYILHFTTSTTHMYDYLPYILKNISQQQRLIHLGAGSIIAYT